MNTAKKWFRHTTTKGYMYDFQATDMAAALKFAQWKFVSGGTVTAFIGDGDEQPYGESQAVPASL